MKSLLIAVFVACAALMASSQDIPILCETRSVDLANPSSSSFAPYVITSVKFGSSARRSWMSLSLTNMSRRAILAVSASLQFRSHNEDLLSIPVRALSAGGEAIPSDPLTQVIEGADVVEIGSGLREGEVLKLSATSFWTTGTCPSHAILKWIRILFDDGSTTGFAANDWQIAASPTEVQPSPLSTPIVAPADISVTADIDENGNVTIGDQGDPLISDWLSKLMNSWRFRPALKGGRPAKSKARFLFQFHSSDDSEIHLAKKDRDINPATTSAAFIAVDIVPPPAGHSRSLIFIGGRLISKSGLHLD